MTHACSACRTSEHTKAAHHDPALAHVEAERCIAQGDDAGARMWRWVARNAERRTCS